MLDRRNISSRLIIISRHYISTLASHSFICVLNKTVLHSFREVSGQQTHFSFHQSEFEILYFPSTPVHPFSLPAIERKKLI